MSEFTDLFIQVGEQVGWDFILLITFSYELFFPERLHPTNGTKLRQLLKEPSEGVVAALEAVYRENEDLSEEKLIEKLNGDVPRSWEFTVEEIRKRPGGD